VADSPAPAVVVEGFSKSFRIPEEQTHTLKERVLHPLRPQRHHRFEALKGATFEVGEGEFFGIVGRNGSGKSTLLKCLAGIYRVDGGRAWIRGRLSTFIELGVGFNLDLPARDNIRLNAIMLGLSTADARRREDEIIAFAGLEAFQDLKIKNYSSGMLVRLGFSIMIHVDADVLLIDEVLAVGDAAFQQKCYEQFDRIRAEGRTVLFVTHDMNAVERYCDRAMLLEKGDVVGIGDPHDIGQQYLQLNFALAEKDAAARVGERLKPEPGRWGDGRAEVLDCWFEDADGARTATLPHGDRATFAARVHFHEDVDDPEFGVELHNSRAELVVQATTSGRDDRTGAFGAGDEAVVRIRFDNVLAGDRYVATPSVAHRGQGQRWMDRREGLIALTVTSTVRTNAAVAVPFEVDVERSAASETTLA
jgi:ABC-type polysaccharide/polyol phosphate transport system ATPase subunit